MRCRLYSDPFAELYKAVIAQSLEPRHIFVLSINERFKTVEGSNPTRLLFFVKEIFLNIIIA